ncbi:hypothetical protein AAMO2058_001183300 [Amorphochlora amoebiformis]
MAAVIPLVFLMTVSRPPPHPPPSTTRFFFNSATIRPRKGLAARTRSCRRLWASASSTDKLSDESPETKGTLDAKTDSTNKLSDESPEAKGGLDSNSTDIYDYLNNIGVKNPGKLLARSPGISQLTKDLIQKKVNFLRSLGIEDPARPITAFPQLLGLRVEGNLDIKTRYLQIDLNLSKAQTGDLICRYPQVLGLSLQHNIKPKILYLESLGIRNISHVIFRFPQIFSLNVQENINPKVKYLESLGLRNINTVIERFPPVLSYSIQLSMVPKVSLLLQLNVTNISRVIDTFPQIFGLSINHNLLPKVRYLHTIGIKNVGKVISSTPQVFSLNIDRNLQPKIAYLRASGIKDIGKLVSTQPQILRLSLENNLIPKLEFFLGPLGLRPIDLHTCHTFFILSLEKRIKKRYYEMVGLGLIQTRPKTDQENSNRLLKLRKWLNMSDSQFRKEVAIAKERIKNENLD